MYKRKKRILIVGDSPLRHTGYAVGNAKIAERLHESGEFVVGVLGYAAATQKNVDFPNYVLFSTKIDNQEIAQKDRHGYISFPQIVLSFKPDIVFTIQDPWIVTNIAQAPKYLRQHYTGIFYCAIDGTGYAATNSSLGSMFTISTGQDVDFNQMLSGWDRIVPFYQGAKQELLDIFMRGTKTRKNALDILGKNKSDIMTSLKNTKTLDYKTAVDSGLFRIEHGLYKVKTEIEKIGNIVVDSPIPYGNLDDYKRICDNAGKKELRKKVFGKHLPDNAFLIGTVSRAISRKQFDIMAQTLRMLIDKEDKDHPIYAYWHIAVPDQGHNIYDLLEQYSLSDRVIIGATRIAEGITTEKMVDIYNSLDLYFLLFGRGGWEVTIAEAAACGVPGVITDFASTSDWATEGFAKVKPIAYYKDALTNTTNAVVSPNHSFNKIYDLYKNKEKLLLLGEKAEKHVEQFKWSKVADMWLKYFRNLQIENIPYPTHSDFKFEVLI